MPATLDVLSSERSTDVVSVLADAFRAYPVMRHILGTGNADYDYRLRLLIGFFVFVRTRHAPAFGMVEHGELMAAAILTLPEEPPVSADVEARREALWHELGDDARHRYEDYSASAATFKIARPHHHLNMIGVRRLSAGTGLARPLLDAVARLSREHDGSAGVSLTTEVPRNVPLYEHFGYRVQGHVRVAPALETWGMWLETRP
jgi:GNAT superfamily N-acetyltransferase